MKRMVCLEKPLSETSQHGLRFLAEWLVEKSRGFSLENPNAWASRDIPELNLYLFLSFLLQNEKKPNAFGVGLG
jgi:hypothetical protein